MEFHIREEDHNNTQTDLRVTVFVLIAFTTFCHCILLIVFAVIETNSRPVVCLHYELDDEESASQVFYVDSSAFPGSGITSVMSGSFLPTLLNSTTSTISNCSLYGTEIIFYNMRHFLGYILFILAMLMLFSIFLALVFFLVFMLY